MPLLDRYLLKRFVVTYLMVVTVVISLFVVIDSTTRLKKFRKSGCGKELRYETERCPNCNVEVEAGAERCPRPTVTELAVEYYVSQTPGIYYQLSPFLVVMSGMLALSLFQHSNELVAMKVAGRSALRIVAPVLVASGVIGAGSWALQEFVIPQLGEMIESAGLIGKRTTQKPEAIPDGSGVLFVREYHTDKRMMVHVLYQVIDGDGVERQEVLANIGVWDDETETWRLKNGAVFRYLENGDRVADAKGRALVKRFRGEETIALPSKVLPRDMVEASKTLASLSSAELREQARRLPRDKARMEVILESRLAYPFAGVILLLIGLPFVLSESTNTWLGLILCMAISGFYYVVTFVLLDIAKVGFIPARFASWAPNLVFGFGGALLMRWKAN